MGEHDQVAPLMAQVHSWATNGEHRSYRAKSRARILRNRRRALAAAEQLIEADIPGDKLEWLLTRKSMLVELGMCRWDLLLPIALRLVEEKPSARAARQLIRDWSGRSAKSKGDVLGDPPG